METRTEDHCSLCPQKDNCREVYEKLGRSDVPNVTGRVIAAFLVPIGTFIGFMVIFEKLLPVTMPSKIRTVTVFVLSAILTLSAVYLTTRRSIRKPPRKACNASGSDIL
jgi:hypothetical protein